MKLYSVSIIIPALNEKLTIGKVIDEIPKEDLQKAGYGVEIVVSLIEALRNRQGYSIY